MSPSPCPAVDELTSTDPLGGPLEQHLSECGACAGLRAICAMRQRDGDDGPAAEPCASFEPLVAAMLDGSIEEGEADVLREHLGRCPSCSQLLGSLSLLRHELEQLPEPEVLAPGAIRLDAPTSAASAEQARRGERERSLAVLLPRRPWVWAAELAAVAAVALVVGHWLGAGPSASRAPQIGPVAEVERSSAPPPSAAAPAPPAGADELLAAGGAAAASAGEAPGSGGAPGGAMGLLNVACRPMCSSVRVDGRSIGPSPVARLTVAAGAHAVTLKREGLEKRVNVRVEAGETTSLVVDMNPEAGRPGRRAQPPGFLNVACQPSYCHSVVVDGEPRGSSPVARLALTPGSHRLVLKSQGTVKQMRVQIRSGEVTSVSARMTPKADEPPPARLGYLTVACQPTCDSVRVDGADLGPSPVLRHAVSPGRHRLTLRSGRLTRPVTVLVEPGETKNLHIAMQAPGR